jgi:hypothetical protein
MPKDKPILMFGTPTRAARPKLRGHPPGHTHLPGFARQQERLAPQFTALQNATLTIQNNAAATEPELTLVFDVADRVDDFYTAIKHLNDANSFAELIFDVSDTAEIDEDFYIIDKNGKRNANKTTMPRKVYCVSTNVTATNQILSLWQRYSANQNLTFPRGKAGLRKVFDSLRDVHKWGIKERLEETGVLQDWQESLADAGQQQIRCELELVYSANATRQVEREREVSVKVQNAGGRIAGRAVIDEIKYHALLVELPRQYVESLIVNHNVELTNAEGILFFRAVGQSVDTNGQNVNAGIEGPTLNELNDEPVIAVFDGLPQENHPYLQNALIVDDPDGYAENYLVDNRKHGTSMASLVIHGDLINQSGSATHKVYVRPIMKPNNDMRDTIEKVPEDILLVDKIHTAVRRLFETVDGSEPVAPGIKIINLSIGIQDRVFAGTISPLARLLDWMSYEYKILFVVSAGNHYDNFRLSEAFTSFAQKPPAERNKTIISQVNDDSRINRLLSPAESMNALTVGAAFSDFSNWTEDAKFILPLESGLPHPASALGRGINRSVKPDIVFYGGRNLILEDIRDNTLAKWRYPHTREPGILSAAPFAGLHGNKELYSDGTSNAAALITHEAGRCYDTLVQLAADGNSIPLDKFALLIKAMLVHGATWESAGEKLAAILSLDTSPRAGSDVLHKFIGYGFPDVDRALLCTERRATLIGFGELKNDEADAFTLPLPFDFGQGPHKRLTVTLASFVPISPSRQKYRTSQVWFDVDKLRISWNKEDVDYNAVKRGSLQHEIFENDDSIVWNEDESTIIKVNCKNDADKSTLPVPYALMVSFEMKDAIDIDVYAKIAEKIRPQITIK